MALQGGDTALQSHHVGMGGHQILEQFGASFFQAIDVCPQEPRILFMEFGLIVVTSLQAAYTLRQGPHLLLQQVQFGSLPVQLLFMALLGTAAQQQ